MKIKIAKENYMKLKSKIILSIMACICLSSTSIYAKDMERIKKLGTEIEEVNKEILKEREILENPEKYSKYEVDSLSNKYNIKDINNKEEIKNKVGILNPVVGMVYSVNQTSYAEPIYQKNNNFFRERGENKKLKSYEDSKDSIRELALKLNTDEKYEKYREARNTKDNVMTILPTLRKDDPKYGDTLKWTASHLFKDNLKNQKVDSVETKKNNETETRMVKADFYMTVPPTKKLKSENDIEDLRKEEFFVGKKPNSVLTNDETKIKEQENKETNNVNTNKIVEENKVKDLFKNTEIKELNTSNGKTETITTKTEKNTPNELKNITEVDKKIEEQKQKDKEIENLLTDNKNIENKVNDLKLFLMNDLTKMKSDVEEKNKKINEIIKEKNNNINTLENKEKKLTQENKEMSDKIVLLDNDIKKILKEKNDTFEELTKVKKEKENIKEMTSKEKNEEIKNLLKEKEELIKNNSLKLKEIENVKIQKENEILTLNKKVESLEKDINDRKIDFVENVKNTKIQIDNLKSNVQTLTKENEMLKNENAKVVALKEENNKIREITVEQVKTISSLQEKVNTLENNTLLNDLKKEVEILKTKNLELEITLKNKNNNELQYKSEYNQYELKNKIREENTETRNNQDNIEEYKPKKVYKNDDNFIDMKDLDKLFEEINEKK